MLSHSIVASVLAATVAAAAPSSGSLAPFRDQFPSAEVSLREGSDVATLITGIGLQLPAGRWADGAAGFVAAWPQLLGYEPSLTTFVLDRAVQAGPVSSYKFRQKHLGLPVVEGEVVVAVDGGGKIQSVSNGLVSLGALDADFTLSQDAALRAAVAAIGPKVWTGTAKRSERAVARVQGAWRAVWHLEFGTLRPLGRWRVLVDAKEPRVLAKFNLVRTVQGYVYEVSPEVGAYAAKDLTDLIGTTTLQGKWIDAYSDCMPLPGYGYDCVESSRQAKADASGNFLFTPAEGAAIDPFAEVQSYFHLGMMHDFYKSLGFNGVDLPMTVATNFTLDQELSCNAAYIGDAMIIGLCDAGTKQVNFAYDSATIMHEYTHGAVDHSAALAMGDVDDWGFAGMPGGLNEGYADFFPAVVLDDHLVGRHVAPALGEGEAFRDLETFKKCPDDLVGEPHDDSVIWSGALWEAYQAVNKDAALPAIVFQGLITLASTATFDDAAKATLAAAANDATARSALDAAFRNHGLIGCGRSVGIASGQVLTGSLFNPYMLQINATWMPGGIQYRLAVPEGATALNLTIKANSFSGTVDRTSSLNVYVSPGSHVVYKGPTTTARWNSAGTGTLAIDAPAPGVYYLLPVGRNFGQSMGFAFEITPEVVGVPVADAGVPDAAAPGLDAGAPPADAAALEVDGGGGASDAGETQGTPDAGGGSKEGGGCSCGTTGAGLSSLPILLLALARFAYRRSRGL